jgi:hypothetical protein
LGTDAASGDVRGAVAGSKPEINPKQIQMMQIQNILNEKQARHLDGDFPHSNFGFVSDFDIRISDFSL